MRNSRVHAFMAVFFMAFISIAQRPELELRLKIRTDTLQCKDVIPLELSIKNISNHSGSILVPNAQNTGNSLFQVVVYQVKDENSSEPYFMSTSELEMDTSRYKSTENFHYLEPGEQFSLPLFINDYKNRYRRFESSIILPDTEPGTYSFQVIYNPTTSHYYKYAFKENSSHDPIPEDAVSEYPDHFLYYGELSSNLVNVHIDNHSIDQHSHSVCNCSLCRSIRNEKWKRVQRKWDKRSQTADHTALLWEYSGPQAILASLPSFAGYDVIFETKSGIVYANFTYQIGKIFPFRSRLSQLWHLVGFRRSPFKTSTVNRTKLISLYFY